MFRFGTEAWARAARAREGWKGHDPPKVGRGKTQFRVSEITDGWDRDHRILFQNPAKSGQFSEQCCELPRSRVTGITAARDRIHGVLSVRLAS